MAEMQGQVLSGNISTLINLQMATISFSKESLLTRTLHFCKVINMQKILSVSLLCLLFSPVYATSIHSALPLKNPIKLTRLSLPPKHNQESSWDDFLVQAGGYGGNPRTGRLTYSGNPSELPTLTVWRWPDTNTCYTTSSNVMVEKTFITNGKIEYGPNPFPCPTTDAAHNNLYWDGYLDGINEAYSPVNDLLYAFDVNYNMFHDWYQTYPSEHGGKKSPLLVRFVDSTENIMLGDYDEIIVGTGARKYYPMSSLEMTSYIIGLYFTSQHSNVSDPIAVSFGCMTAMAAEYYTSGRNTWQIGSEVAKDGKAIHYMDIPSKNCEGKQPGDACDIDTLAQYKNGMSGFYSAGLFNRAFYLLANSNGWNTRKAYDVFVQANIKHWVNKTDFHQGACDVVLSAKELNDDTASVMVAFSGVGIDTRDC